MDDTTAMQCGRVDELSTTLSGQLKITGDAMRAPVERYYIDDDNNDDDDDDDEEEDLSEEDLLAQMGYAKSDPNEAEEEEDEEEDLSEDSILAQMGYLKNELPKHEPINIPIEELNLVSAFKGSREREEGRPVKGCRVSWAPDVYDPPCTSDDHYTESRTERHKSEHKAKGASGKNRQKSGGKGGGGETGGGGGGKGSRGGGGSSKGNEGGSKTGGGGKEKKKAEKKHKKRGHGEY